MGISTAAYPRENIKGMTRARAADICRRHFWNAVKDDELPAGLDLVAFDAAVNSGPARGAKWLQGAVDAVPDGKIGTATIAAARKADTPAAIHRACDARTDFLRSLGTWKTFGKGWGASRVDDVRSTALLMAAPARPAPKPETGIPASPYAPPTRGPGSAIPIVLVVAAIKLIGG